MAQEAAPSSPFHTIPHISNFREVTSLPIATDSSLRTRPALIYRSGAYPLPLPPSTLQALAALNISSIYDLRSAPEINRAAHSNTQTVSAALTAQHPILDHDSLPSSALASSSADTAVTTSVPQISDPIQRLHTPVFANLDFSPAALAQRYRAYASPDGTAGFVQSYRGILSEGGAAFGQVCRRVLRRPNEPLLINCTAGKDRTGVAVALLLSLASVDDELVAEEYALSAEGLAVEMKTWVPMLMRLEGLKGDEEGARRLLGSRKESMLAMLNMLRREFGGAETYLKGKCGLDEEEVENLRDCLRIRAELAE